MAKVTAQMVKELREITGAGMMDCKRALEEAGGNFERAQEILREQGLASAQKKRGRAAGEGLIHAYIHHGGRVGVLVEVNCETDFVARTEDFQELVHNIALQIAATAPLYVRRDQVPAEIIEKERALLEQEAKAEGKPEQVVARIVEGRLDKFLADICLEEQPYIRDDKMTVGQLVAEAIARLGENIRIRRFVRYELGQADGEDPASTGNEDSDE